MKNKVCKSALAIFAKEPIPGQVKTRLAQSLVEIGRATDITLGLEMSSEYFLEFLQAWNSKVKSLTTHDIFLFYSSENTPKILKSQFSNINPNRYMRQSSGDLGEKMTHCVKDLSAMGYQKVMIVGTDSPDLPLAYIEEGFDKLNTIQSCLGPCEDGGYYTIGFQIPDNTNDTNSLLHQAFNNIPWSTSTVFKNTVQNYQKAIISHHLLPLWYDIDSTSELDRYLGQ